MGWFWPAPAAPADPAPTELASVRYLIDDVRAAIDFYATYLGFTVAFDAAPTFAAVRRGLLRLLLSGLATSGARATPDDAATAGRNRIHLVVDDLDAIDRLRQRTGATQVARRDIVAEVQAAGLGFERQVIYGCLRRMSGHESGSAYLDLEVIGDGGLRRRS